MALYKEIVTKAVIGKGKKSFKNNYTVDIEDNADTILGCWVINHKFEGYKSNDKVGVKGDFDINIWYSYDNNTKTNVVNKNITYEELLNIKLKPNIDNIEDTDIIVRSLYQPNCSNVEINGKSLKFTIDKELGIELVGEEKVKIAIEEDEDPWDIIDDEMTKEDEKNIDNDVNEEYF
jgi:spore coat protein E